MNALRSIDWTAHSVRIAACGVGAVLGGPLGSVLGGWLGSALGPSAVEIITRYAEKFSEGAAVKLLDIGADVLVQGGAQPSESEALYREALQLSLKEIHVVIAGTGFDDWFANWADCLDSSIPLALPETKADHVGKEKLQDQFRHVMEILDAQGSHEEAV